MIHTKLPVWVFMAVFLLSANAAAQTISLRGTLNLGQCTAVDAVNDVAYIALSGSFRTISLANPSQPSVLGQTATGAATTSAIEVGGNYAYGAGQADGLVIVNVSRPGSLVLVTRFSVGYSVRDIAVFDTLVAVATPANVILIGVRNPAQPHTLTTYGRTASWVEFSPNGRLVHVGSTGGAYSLDVTVNISGGDTTFALSLNDEYGSDVLTPVALCGNYLDVVRSSTLVALNASNYTVAGQRTSSGAIRALTADAGFCFTALATGTIEYLDQRTNTPSLITTAAIHGTPNALALGQSGTQRLLIAAYSSGVAVYEYDALSAAEPPPAPLPEGFKLSAFPNPFNGIVSLTIVSHRPGNADLRIFDLLGREVHHETITLAGGSTEYKMRFTSRPAGIYWAQLRQSEFSTTAKLLYIP